MESPDADYAADTSSGGTEYEFELAVTASTVTFKDLTRGLTFSSSDTSYRGTDAIVSGACLNTSAIIRDVRVSL